MTRADLLLLAIFFGPGTVAYLLAKAWIGLGNALVPWLAPDVVPWELAKAVSFGTWGIIGAAMVVAGIWESAGAA